MFRIPYNRLLATLLLTLLAGQTPALLASAGAAATPTINKAQLNQAVQEALAKESGSAAGGSTGSSLGSSGSESLGGSSGSLSNLTSGEGEEEASTPTTPTTNVATTSGGVSTGVLLPIFIVGAILLGGIAFFIVRDARGVAPVVDGFGNASTAQERAVRLRKRRAKAKAARQQRKRNR